MIEKVNPSHPDKIADRIAGALVDMAYMKEKDPKIAVEVLIGHGKAHIIAESSVALRSDDICKAVRRIAGRLRSIMYDTTKTRTLRKINAVSHAVAITEYSKAFR